MADAKILAYAGATAPSGWYACEGQSLLRVDEPDLFAAIGTTYGAADATHFSLPDLRERFALGKAAAGTGSSLGASGGSRAHTHGLTHAHTVTQPSAHAAHVVTQPGAHASLTHSGFGADDHAAASHAGMSVAAHSVTKSSAHGTHGSGGSHDHDAHDYGTFRSTGSSGRDTPQGKHSADGSHTHDSHSAHTETVSGHTISSQGANHGVQSHSATQPSAHSLGAHALTVGAHSAHSGTIVDAATVTSAGADPPYLALIFIIATATSPVPSGAVLPHGTTSAPTGYLICNGQAVSRATYATLWGLIGTTYGPGDGSTTFNVPDLRGRHVIGVSGSVALAASGGGAAHTHAGSAHTHVVSQQAGAHTDHTVTQPSHGALVHSAAALASHSMSHSGFAVAAHTVTQSGGHGTHDAAGGHNHNAHGAAGKASGTDLLGGPANHNTEGSHDHDAHSAHSGAGLSGHSETQANTHTATHSVTQPNDHAALVHAGAALTPHSAHANAAVTAGASAATDVGEAPYLALTYLIATDVTTLAIGSLYKVGQASAPSGTLLCEGQAVSRTTYADLFAEIGTTYGAGDGSTTFNLPDLRGRIPRGANGDLAGAGGTLDHTHAVSSTHGHATTQPDAHGAHGATQPNDHPVLSHVGAGATAHSLSHAGADIDNHTATQAASHPAHVNAGGHDHDAHTAGGGISETSGPFTTVLYGPIGRHNTEGSHTHSGAHSHSGFGVNGHSVGQANAHSMSHSVDQPNDHAALVHAGFGVDSHGAHSGFALAASGTGTTTAANPPYLVVNYVIQSGVDTFTASAEVTLAIGAPEVHFTDYTIELNEIPTTPPSSPIILVLSPPE